MEWNEDTIAGLRALWDEGHSTAEIGRRMGISKNAVVGKAHRLALPPRPSPIRRGEAVSADRAPPRRAQSPTLPPLDAPAAEARPDAGLARRAEGARPPPAPAPAQPPRPLNPAKPGARTASCCWPIGEPGTRSFRFCDTPAMAGKPYCTEHVQLAYVKVRDRREDAA